MAEVLTLEHVGKVFSTSGETLPVLNDVHLTVAAGEFVALLGPSGCGKSTLLRLIAGLEQPSVGSVRLGEQVVADTDPRCALMFQEPRLFPWKTVAANIAVGTRRSQNPPAPALFLNLVGLNGFEAAYPHQLSGGMAQRAALARALIGRPELLLLDEPFGALDALTRMQMQDLLAAACRSAAPTVVMVTHDVDEALYLADRIVVMGPRPASVLEIVSVPSSRPRDRGSPLLAEMRAMILARFGLAHARTTQPDDIYAI
ncbi:MAG: ABC transporter ATP-binding protein [Roseiflexaceae bacterium]|nr:ABC transporter ATP-binding protein [Roseiflexaceae bacterium]